MGIQNWSDNIILINLAQEPQLGEELQTVLGTVQDRQDVDVVVDFADVDIITSSSIAKLLRLRKAIVDCSRQIVLSSVKPRTQKVFAVTGLDGVFEFVSDQFLALAGMQLIESS
jgi:anti-anti-sigma factor